MYLKLQKHQWVKIDKTGIIFCLNKNTQLYMIYRNMFKNGNVFLTSYSRKK